MIRFAVVLMLTALPFLAAAQPPDISFIKGKILYHFNFKAQKFDSLKVELKQGDKLIATTWARNMKFEFKDVKAGTYETWVKIPNSKKFDHDGIEIVLGRDGYALPAYPVLEIWDVNLEGLEPKAADKVRKEQVKWEKKQR